jgi:small-conductance mechanosensitive channel
VLIIPNANFVSNSVSNRSRRTHRQLTFTITLEASSLPSLAAVEGILRDLKEKLRRELPDLVPSKPFRLVV